jgi:indole-3-glycerol phosphate synthase
MSDFLEQVVAQRRSDVARDKLSRPEAEILADLRDNLWTRWHGAHVPVPGRFIVGSEADAFSNALHRRKRQGQIAVIAEVKRRSPALGTLASRTFSPADQAHRYAAAGATAISVLTEPRHWGGSFDDLAAVRDAVDIPVLCKDVIVDEYQIAQARAAGADAVLLIAEALSDEQLRRFVSRALTLSMGALVEAHESVAFGRAVAAGSQVVGVNARDLRHPDVIDIGRVRQLHTFAAQHHVLVAESGITTVDDVRLLPRRVDAILVGTVLMRAADPTPLIRAFASARRPTLARAVLREGPR